MENWQFLSIIGVVFVILEIFTPALFFFNLALASFLTALIAFFWAVEWSGLLPLFVVSSLVFLVILRPLLIKKRTNNTKTTGMDEKYIGKTAKVIERITPTSGVVSLYDERWQARSIGTQEYEEECEVKIVKNESLIFYVEKL